MMEANASWLPACKTMSEHLPLVSHADDPDMVKDRMYVSPPVSVEDEDSMEPVINTLDECGMMLFNLGRIQSLIENRLLTTKVPMTVWSHPDRSYAVYGTLPLFLAMVLCAGFPSA